MVVGMVATVGTTVATVVAAAASSSCEAGALPLEFASFLARNILRHPRPIGTSVLPHLHSKKILFRS